MRITGGENSERKPRVQPQDDAVRAPGAHTEGTRKGGLPAADRIEISGEARGLQAAAPDPGAVVLDKARGAAEPALDPVFLEEIREKIKAGFYDTSEVTRSIADRMLDLLGLKRSK